MLAMMPYIGNDGNNKKERKMMKMIFSKELAERLNVSVAEILPLSRPKLSELKVGKISFYPPMPIPAFR